MPGEGRLPDVRFWTLDFDGAGVVHVHDRFVDGADIGRTNMPLNPWTRARCGLLRREQSVTALSTFSDDRLCRACHAATPPDQHHELFEHPIRYPAEESP